MGIYRKGFKEMFERGKWRIMRGDKVMITAGKDAGQVGTVLKVIRDSRWPRVLVEGQNLVGERASRHRSNERAATARSVAGAAVVVAARAAAAPALPSQIPSPPPLPLPLSPTTTPYYPTHRTSGTSSAARTTRAAS